MSVMLPVKWKAFKFLCYLQFSISAIAYPIAVIFLLDDGNINEDFLGFLLVTIYFLTVLLNSILNLHILKRYFPNNLLIKKIRRAQNVGSFFLAIIILLLFIFLIGEISNNFPFINYDRPAKLYVCYSIFVLITSLYIWPLQLQIESYLRIRNSKKIKELITSIGNENLE